MKNTFKTFSKKIERSLDLNHMWIPDRSEASQFRLANHDYGRIRASWRVAKNALNIERAIINRLEMASDFENEYHTVSDELYDDEDVPLQCLDIGVASVVLSLSGLGCHTLSSCNGGCFGDS